MISLLFTVLAYSDEVCLVGTQANKDLCPTRLTNRMTFSEVPDSLLQTATTFVICGEATQTNQGDTSSTSTSPVVSLILRSSQLAKAQNSEMPLLTFTSMQDTRQKILLSDVSDSTKAKCAFINIDFIQGQTQLFSFLDLTFVGSLCTNTVTTTSLVVERTLNTDICSIACWQILQSQPSTKVSIVLNSENEIENSASSSVSFSVNFRASVTILNAHQFKEIILSQGSSNIDLTVVSTKDVEFTITGILYFDDCSIDVYFGNIITTPAIFNFVSTRAYSKTTFPKIKFETTNETTISINGEWTLAKDSIQSMIDSRMKAIIAHKTKLILQTSSFRPQITHTAGNLTFQLGTSSCTIPQQLIESSTTDCFLIFTPSGNLNFSSGISLSTTKTQLEFTNPQEFTLIIGTIDTTQLGSFTYFPFKFRMYRSSIGRISFPNIQLTNVETPLLTASNYVIIDPDVATFPTLTQSEVQRMTPDTAQTFLTAPLNSGFAKAKLIFPTAQNQIGFWKDSSILVTSVESSTNNALKATIDGNIRKTLPLMISLGSNSVAGYFTTDNLPADKLSGLITDVTQNIIINVQENANTYIDFSGVKDTSKASLNYSITGASGKAQSLKLLNSNSVTGLVTIKSTIIDCDTDLTIAFKKVSIQDCYFTAAAARVVQFSSSSEINITMTWDQFVSFGTNKKVNGPVDFTNANLKVLATGLQSLVYSSVLSIYPENPSNKFDMSLNDANHIPTFECSSDQDILIKSNDGSLTTKGLMIKIGGSIRLEGTWTYKIFDKPIQIVPLNSLTIVLTDKTLPTFTISDSTLVTYSLDNDFAYNNFKNRREIDFPSWFAGNKILCPLTTLDDNFAISVSPNTNKILFDTLTIVEGATVNIKTIEVRQKIIVNKECTLVYEGDSDKINSIEVRWNADKGFPSIQLLGQINSNSIYFLYSTSQVETVSTYNKLFNNSIDGTQSYGVSVIKTSDILLPSLFSFSPLPDAFSSAKLSVLSKNGYFYVTSNLISEVTTSTVSTPTATKKAVFASWMYYAIAGAVILIIMIIIGVSTYIYHKHHQLSITIANDPDCHDTQIDTRTYVDPERGTMQRRRVRKSPAKAANVVGQDNEESSEYYYEYTYEYISDNDYSNGNVQTDPEEYISEDEVPLQNIYSAKRTPQSVKSVKSAVSASQRSLPTTQGLSPVPTSKSSIRSPIKSPGKSPIKVPHPPAAFSPNKFVSPRRAIVVSYANQNKRPEILKNDENTPKNNRDIPKPQFILVPEDQIRVENMNNNRARSEGKKRRNSDGEQVQAITDAIQSHGFLVNKEMQPQQIPKSAKTPQTRRMRRANSPRRSMTPNEVQNIRHELAKENFNNEEMNDNNIRRITSAVDDDITPRRKRRVAPPSQQRVPTYISPRSLCHENNSQASNSVNIHAKSPRNYYVTPNRDIANIDITSDEDSDVPYN